MKKKTYRLIFFLSVLFCLDYPIQIHCAPNNPKPMVVKVPVADIRSKPSKHSKKYEFDPLQETQVEQGEAVLIWKKKGGWVYVECPEQSEYSHNDRWEGYPGWMRKKDLTDDLSLLHHLTKPPIPESDLRQQILAKAALHLGSPYLWGGRSLYDPNNKTTVTGVDCSGLVNWSFRQLGIFIPRDAHEQFMKARPVLTKNMKPADLIFSAKADKPEKIVHVAFYAGEGQIIEAPQSGEKVRKISVLEKYGKTLDQLERGMKIGDRVIYFGTLLTEGL